MNRLPDHASLVPAIDALAEVASEDAVLRYTARLITPMAGGGVEKGEPDPQQPFRARSLRGQLRFWWRVLARGGGLGAWNGKPLAELSARDWRDWESSIWGGLGDRPDELRASAIGLRVRAAGAVSLRPYASGRFHELMPGDAPQEGAGANHNWANYVFFSARPTPQNGHSARKLVAAGARFELDVVIRGGNPEMVKVAQQVVRLWATFGGMGARTRRGAGAVAVVERGAPAHQVICALADPGLKTLTSLRVARQPAVRSAYFAYREAVQPMIEFRQMPPLARSGEAQNPRSWGLSHWPEPHQIRRTSGHWSPGHDPERTVWAGGDYPLPRAQFGLPIVVHFKGGPDGSRDVAHREPADRTIVPVLDAEVRDRMASPLILRPVVVPGPNGVGYASCAVLLDCQALGDHVLQNVTLVQGSEAHEDDWPVWTETWNATGATTAVPALDQWRSGRQLPGGFEQANSAPEAFFNYFLGRRGGGRT